jgi:hypothetical protein
VARVEEESRHPPKEPLTEWAKEEVECHHLQTWKAVWVAMAGEESHHLLETMELK